MTEPDSISSRISPSCPSDTQRILTAAWAHDVATLKPLLDAPGKASARDPSTRETPLHAAIRSCGSLPALDGPDADQEDAEDLEKAAATVRELFQWGAIWNDLDDRGETPGCVARRLGRTALYDLCVGAGVRAEMLFGVLGGYEELSSGGEGEDEGGDEDFEVVAPNGTHDGPEEDGDEVPELVDAETAHEVPPTTVTSEAYLGSQLTYADDKLLDASGNGVMMAWETEIMRRSVAALIPSTDTMSPATGKRILNIGFGMGIIDTLFAATRPSVHHIIEAHPDLLARISGSPDGPFGTTWEAGGPQAGAYKMHAGRWQDVCTRLLEDGQTYDAIYFDTFGEDYTQLHRFFTDFIPGLLDQHGIFGFFNGLGADRQICYDVYTHVAEMHLADAGLDVEWQVVDVDMTGLNEEAKGAWQGVRRRYWTLDSKWNTAITKLFKVC